jgi:hypothetical protein
MSGHGGEEIGNLAPIVHPVNNHCTDRATSAHIIMKLELEEIDTEYYVDEHGKCSSNNIFRTEPFLAVLFISHPFCCLVPNYHKHFTICNYPNNFDNRPLTRDLCLKIFCCQDITGITNQ